jgi:hypothetical protein
MIRDGRTAAEAATRSGARARISGGGTGRAVPRTVGGLDMAEADGGVPRSGGGTEAASRSPVIRSVPSRSSGWLSRIRDHAACGRRRTATTVPPVSSAATAANSTAIGSRDPGWVPPSPVATPPSGIAP